LLVEKLVIFEFLNLRYDELWLLEDVLPSTNFELVLSHIAHYDGDTFQALLLY
jgi:hypothetical protein